MQNIEIVIQPREKDLGGFSVRRILPYATHRMVGPFIFFDHMGPALFHLNEGMDVRPHPHIGLATVTYLFEGKIRHRDSLGSDQMIEPGAINWMTAGKGIVHSERTPEELRLKETRMNGIQCWVALPEEFEDVEPSFIHYPSHTLPEFEKEGVQFKLLIGSAYHKQSPVKTHSDLFYLEAKLPKGSQFTFPSEGQESAAYLVEGKIQADGVQMDQHTMAVAADNGDLLIEALEDSRIMLLGGKPVGKRFIYWNFVSSSQEKLEAAKKDWAQGGPRPSSDRFPLIPGDDKEFIPLPAEPGNPKGTIM